MTTLRIIFCATLVATALTLYAAGAGKPEAPRYRHFSNIEVFDYKKPILFHDDFRSEISVGNTNWFVRQSFGNAQEKPTRTNLRLDEQGHLRH